MRIALVHDYLTQRGGAERVVLSMLKAFPGAPLYTSFYDPEGTFPEFQRADVRPLSVDRVSFLRRHHRLALPLLAPAFSRLYVDADVAVCSSSGWAHGACVAGRKIVYCHAPARWLYQPDVYTRDPFRRTVARAAGNALRRWDRNAASSADRYLVNSTVVCERVRTIYGREAEILFPPPAFEPTGEMRSLPDVAPGFLLCVSRLLPYKNVDLLVDAVVRLPDERLVVAGAGPDEDRLRERAGPNVRFVGFVDDAQLRWLYANCRALAAASYEDFGLTPLEAALFGKPSVALGGGGYLDTIEEGVTGVFFERADPESLVAAIRRLETTTWDPAQITRHTERFSEASFVQRLRTVVDEVHREVPRAA